MAAIKNVFITMLQTDIIVGEPMVKDGENRTTDVSAIIAFTGEIQGHLALCYPLRTALKVASAFADCEITQHHPDFADALGELANMVAGNAKARLPGLHVNISLPHMVAGRNLQLLTSPRTPVLIFACDSTLGRFTAEVTMIVKS
jgi:chemotaxis protein CheX